MRLLRDEPVEVCFMLGRRLGKVFAMLRGPAGDEWRRDGQLTTSVAVYGGTVTDLLAPHVLSEPAARKLAMFKRWPAGLRRLVFDLTMDLINLDLHGASAKSRWLAASFMLGQLPSTKSRTDRATLLRSAAEQLAPTGADKMLAAIEGLKKRDAESWLNAIGEAARLGTLRADATSFTGASSTWRCAWQPLRLFISHSSQDKPLVRRLDSRLRDRVTLDVILDERDLRPGTALAPAIAKHIASCDWLIVCMSQHALMSSWVEQEIAQAQQHGVRIMPLRLDDAPLSPQLRDNLHADFTTAFDVAVERLVAALTDSPVYPFLTVSTSPAIEAAMTIEPDHGPLGNRKLARLTVRLRAHAPTRVESLLLTTIVQWTITRPDTFANAQVLEPPPGAVHIRPAPGSKALVPIGRELAAGERHEVSCVLYTDHCGDPGMGLYPFLIGAEVLLHDGDPLRLGVALADLYGGEIVGHSQFGGSIHIVDVPANQRAQEILRVLPATCVADAAFLDLLRKIAAR